MNMRNLIPWNRGRDLSVRGEEGFNPLHSLHREMNRLFDDAFRGFDLAPFGTERFLDRSLNWPSIEVSENEKEVTVTAELPGLDEKNIEVGLANNVLTIKGEKTTETEDKDRLFSERTYGRFERRIPVDQVEEDKVSAAFKNGVLTVSLPKAPGSQSHVKRIAVSAK